MALLPVVKAQFHVTAKEVIPLDFGSGGAFPRAMEASQRAFDFTSQDCCPLTILRTSLKIGRDFLDYGWPTNLALVSQENTTSNMLSEKQIKEILAGKSQ